MGYSNELLLNSNKNRCDTNEGRSPTINTDH